MKLTTRNVIITFSIIIILFITFHLSTLTTNYQLDTDTVSIYIDLINALVIIFLTLLIYKYNEKKDALDFKTKTPLVSIKQEDDSYYYVIQNIGGGPALNIRVLSDLDDTTKTWRKNIIAFDLFGNNTFILDTSNKKQYLITYNDIYGSCYYSYMKNNELLFGNYNFKEINQKNALSDKIIELLHYNKNNETFSERQAPSV